MQDNIKIGDPIFNKMIFTLKQPITKANHKDYRYRNEEMHEIADDIWAMPAYMKADDDYSIFFIFTKIESGQTVIAFSEGKFDHGDFSLGTPLPTGEGLNRLKEHNADRSAQVLKFINLISKANEGNWRMLD